MGKRTPSRRQSEARETWRVKHPFRASAPFLGASCALLSALVLANSCTVCYAAAIQGERVAFFQQEADYQCAVVQAEEKASRILNTDYSLSQEATVSTAVAPKSKVETLPQVTNSLLDNIPELAHLYTLSVDGVRVGAARSAQDLEQALSLVKAQYATPDTLSVQIESQVSLRYEYLPAETPVLTPQNLAELLLVQTPQCLPYTVQEGDTLEDLLARFSMTQERLQALNPDIDLTASEVAMGLEWDETSPNAQLDAEDFAEIFASEFGTPLEVGLVLTVEQLCPRLVVSTVEEQRFTRAVLPTVETQPDDTMYKGEQRIVQPGQAGEEEVLARVVKRCGVTVASTDLTSVVTTQAVPLTVGTGTQPMPELPEGMFLWPVRGHLTSDFGYRFIFGETNFHRGVDLAAPAGTAISAAAGGVVTYAGVKGTYGNLVVVSHGNGFVTYYAHCSKILVEAGESVTQGQPLAAVGSTGRSTGPHLHFEVRYQNTPIDPFLYLPGENNAPYRDLLTEEDEEEPEETETPEEETPEETVEPTLPEDPATDPATDPAEPIAPTEPTPDAQPPEPETPATPPTPTEEPIGPLYTPKEEGEAVAEPGTETN